VKPKEEKKAVSSVHDEAKKRRKRLCHHFLVE
jgi:hypothetical protein